MKSIASTFALIVVLSALMTGCDKPGKDCTNTRTPEQQQQADRTFDMGQPTDRSKNKGF